MPDAAPQAHPDDGPSSLRSLLGGRLLDRLPAAVYAACPGEFGEWLYVSPRITDILGYQAADFMTEPGLWARLLHPEDREWVLAQDVRFDQSEPIEYRMTRADGRVVWVLDDSVVGSYREHPRVHHGLLSDISERKRDEMLLAAHATVTEGVARGADLIDVLVLVAQVTDEISGSPRCQIELDKPTGRLVSDLPIRGDLVISAAGAHDAGFGRNVVVPACEVSVELPDGSLAGRISLSYAADTQVGPEDRKLLDWAARLVTVVAMRAVEHGRTADSLALLAATLDSTADGILVLDNAGQVVGQNKKFLDMWGLSSELAISTDGVQLARAMSQLLTHPGRLSLDSQPGTSLTDELELLDGRIFERYQHVQHGVSADHRIGRVWSFRDVSANRTMQQELREQAFNDPVTPLANRACFVQRLSAALKAPPPSQGHLAVLLLDLDDFKTVNDGLGYASGDKLLIAVAERLLGCLRARDTAARLGGDEFVVLLQDLADPEEARFAAERILAAISRPLTIDGQVLTVRVSVGIAVSAGGGEAAELMRNADLAMYTAKRAGGSCCRRYTPGMHTDAVARMELKSDLERAINAEQLSVCYQPVVDLVSGRILGVEALVRWNHPSRGAIAPLDFIPLAEQTGLIERLGRWVLRQACADTALWRRAIPGQEELSVSVNLSPRQLSNAHFPDEVRRVLWSTGLPATALILEITESMLVEPGVDAVSALGQLKEIGLSLALDDFGTGYSSLAQMITYPLDVVKVDKSFVDHIDGDPANSALVLAVLNIARALSLSVTVEGIETAEQLRLLCGMGALRGQGYFMSRPLPADEVRVLLEQANVSSIAAPIGRRLRLS